MKIGIKNKTGMIKWINLVISRLKKESFTIDSKTPLSYLLYLLLGKLRNTIYGFLIFGRKNLCLVHPSSIVKCRSKINFGNNLSIDRWCYIDALSTDGIKLGNNVSIGKSTTIECSGSMSNIGKGLVVKNNVGFGTHGFFGCAGGVEIGDNTIMGNFVSFHSENHCFSNPTIPIRLQGVSREGIKIGQNCWIGAKVTVLDGVIIGNGCIIAAGAVVKKGIYQENGIYAGVPAKLIKYRI